MKSIKNIFLLILNAAVHSATPSSFGTVLLVALFDPCASVVNEESPSAGETSYTVLPKASFEFECASDDDSDKCCASQFRDNECDSGCIQSEPQVEGTVETTCMSNHGTFGHCKDQENCTVTCSAGCSGKNEEDHSGQDSTEPEVSTDSFSACSGNNCGGGGGGQDSTEPEVTEPEVSTDSASACSGYGPCDVTPSGCTGSGCISKSQVITLGRTAASVVFAAAFLAI